MGSFSEELKKARLALGYKSARTFFTWLKSQGVSFNYSYYMQLEQSGLPSEKITNELALAIGGDWTQRLILAHCRELFPKHKFLFSNNTSDTKIEPSEIDTNNKYTPAAQKELTLKQVSVIATNEITYHLFLLATLARMPVKTAELQKWIPQKSIQTNLALLIKEDLVKKTEDGYQAKVIESKFPPAFNAELKEYYAKFDAWDESFGEKFSLETILNKMIIRRVSPRYLSIIRNQLETLFELVRSSDETDTKYNEKVLQLKVIFRHGQLPG